MPTVQAANPPYTGAPQNEPGFVPTQGFTQRATPEAFGAGVGRAISGLGETIGQAGNIFAENAIRQQDLHNQIVSNDGTNDYIDGATKLLTEYNAKAGQDAMGAYQQYTQGLEDLRNQVRSRMQNPRQQLAFDTETRRTQAIYLARMGEHYDTQLKQAAINSDKATQVNAAFGMNNAAINGDDAAFNSFVTTSLTSRLRLLESQGATQEMKDAATHEVFENAVINKTEALRTVDPEKAMAFLESHQDLVFDKNHYNVLHNSLQPLVDESKAAGAVDRAMGRGPPVSGVATGGAVHANYAKTSGMMGNPDDPNYERDNIVTIKSPGGASFRVNKLAADAFQGFVTDLEKAGYHIDPATSGGYNNRNITGGTEKSEHAYGNAIDINSTANLYSREGKLTTDLPANVRDIAAKWNIGWGGDWHDLKDAMHFEWLGPKSGGTTAASFDNNIGNVKANAPSSYGPGGPRNEYATFATPQEGAAAATSALVKNANAISTAGDTPTVAKVMARYAPDAPSDYINGVATAAGVKTNEPLPINDPTKMTAVVQAVAKFEGKSVSQNDAAQGVRTALGGSQGGTAPKIEVWGDSLGNGLRTALKTTSGYTHGGDTPEAIFANIKKQPESHWQGLTVALPSGSNGDQMPVVEDTIKYLKGHGANVIAVGYGPRFPEKNAQLNEIAGRLGVPVVKAEDVGAVTADPQSGIHPSPGGYNTMAGNIRTAASAAPGSDGKIITDEPSPEKKESTPTTGQPIYTRGTGVLATTPTYIEAQNNILNDPTLTAVQRQKALSKLNSEYGDQVRLQHDLDSAAHQTLSDWQTKNEAELYAKAMRGEDIDKNQVAWMVQNQFITPDAANAIQAEQVRRGKGTDNADVFNDLDRRARAGEDITADLNAAVERGDITGRTALSLYRADDARKQKRTDAVEKSNFATLRTIAGMDAQNQPTFTFQRDEDRQAQVSLWAQAQQEWTDRVEINGEDSTTVLRDMGPRYTNTPQQLARLIGRQPKFGTVTKPQDLQDIAAKTKAAHDNGQLTDDQYQSEQDLLVRYKRGLDAQQQRTDALGDIPKPTTGTPTTAPQGSGQGRVRAQ